MKKINFDEEQIQQIIKLYVEEHISLTKLAKQFNVSRTVITRIIKEQHIDIRQDNHSYYAEYRMFKNIDNAEKAYWLGFIAADGCVFEREDNASIKLNIHERDELHLIKLRTFLKGNMPIKHIIQNAGFSNNTPMVRIDFNSIEMVEDFKKHGVTPRKSLNLKPPLIDKQFYLPYILGYFDGDGSIFENGNEFGINIEGTKETLDWINSLLNISSSLEQRKESDKNNYYIRCGGIQKPYNIMKKLYNSCPVHLDRKYEKFLKLQSRLNQ